MKRKLSLILALSLCLSLASCGAGKEGENSEGAETGQTSPREESGSKAPELKGYAIVLSEQPGSYELKRFPMSIQGDNVLIGYTASKEGIFYLVTNYAEASDEHTSYDLFRLDPVTGENSHVLNLYEGGSSFFVGKPCIIGRDIYFLAQTELDFAIVRYSLDEDKITTIESIDDRDIMFNLASDDRYLCWVMPEGGAFVLKCYDSQEDEVRLVSRDISEKIASASLTVSDGVCTVLEEGTEGSFIVSYDLAQGQILSSKPVPEGMDIRKLQGGRQILSFADGLGKDALTYCSTHELEDLSALFKSTGSNIASFSSHIYGSAVVINSQYPPEILVVYPYDGQYERIELEQPLFSAALSCDGIFTAIDNNTGEIICMDLGW